MNCIFLLVFVFFFKQKTAYEMLLCDWSSDVCSSDLVTVDLRPIDRRRQKRKRNRRPVAGLAHESPLGDVAFEVDAVPVQARWRTGFQTTPLEVVGFDRLRERAGRRSRSNPTTSSGVV